MLRPSHHNNQNKHLLFTVLTLPTLMNSGSEKTKSASAPDSRRGATTFPLAVIELGTSAIRMAIGQTDGATKVKVLEQLVRGVSLGKDTFTSREIQKKTLQDCISVLKSYRRKLNEYQFSDPQHIRVVATSAVREAVNRLAVLDRIYVATGFAVDLIDNAEIARVTYLGVRPSLQEDPELRDGLTVVAEVGGGNTEVLVFQGRDIVHSQPYRLGSLRLQQMLHQYQAAQSRAGSIMTGQIDRTLEPLIDVIPAGKPVAYVGLGGDVRFAARVLGHPLPADKLTPLPVSELEQLTRQLLDLSVDRIMQLYHVELSQAETLVPALLANVRAARLLGASSVLATSFNLRDALLRGMLRNSVWSQDFCDQVLNSAMEFARKFQVDLPHAQHVARLADKLFQALHGEHGLDERAASLLQTAALLHKCGLFINTASYHKHSHYLIINSDLFGLSALDHTLVAQIARYHRRAHPKPTHEAFARLDRDSRVIVSRLAGLLRVAVALDHVGNQRIQDIACTVERNRLVITTVNPVGDLSLERMELRQHATLFEDTFGLSVLLRDSA
jgi:exopolyphosphatase / guanosine-5'-triphosphate,3'-diphosphate pyrophosphatase